MDPSAPSPRPNIMGKPPPSDSPHPLPSSHSHFPSHQPFGYSASAPFAQPSLPNQSSALSQQFHSAHNILTQSQPLTSTPHKIARTSTLHSPHEIKNHHPLPSSSQCQLPSSQQLNHLQTTKQPQQPPFSGGFKPLPQSSSVALPASSASQPAFSSSIPLLTRTSHHFQGPSITPIHAQRQLPQSQNNQDQSSAQQNRQVQQSHQQSIFQNQQFYQPPRQPPLQNRQRQQLPLQQSQLNDVKQPTRTSAFAISRPPTHSEPFPNSKSLPFPISHSHHPQSVSPSGQSPTAARPPNPGSSSAPLPLLSQPSTLPSSTVGSTIPHPQPSNQLLLYDIAKLHSAQCSIIGGKVYNDKGHSICGVLNQHDKPCKRIGKCPFHGVSQPVSAENSCNGFVDASGTATPDNEDEASPRGTDGHTLPDGSPAGGSTSSNLTSTPKAIPKKQQYKHGWSKEEHFLFLRGLQVHDRGSWKQISNVVQSRNATQVQSHAQKYFLRQKQNNKNKRSIHDLTMDSPEMQELEKRFRNGEFKNVIPSLGLSENMYEPPTVDGSTARHQEEGIPGFGQAMTAADQGIAGFGQTDTVGNHMVSDTNLPRFGQSGGGVVPRLGPGQAMSATTLGSSVSSGVQIPQLHNAHQARGNFQGNAFMQPQDLLGHAGAAASAQKKFSISPMRPRSDVPQPRDVLLSAARPAFPHEVYQSNLGPMQSSMGPILPSTHGMSPKPAHKVIDPAILQPGSDRNMEGQTDHASTQPMYVQHGFSGLYSQPSGNTGVLQQARVSGDSQLSWAYGNETKPNRRLRDVMTNGKDAIALQNSFTGIMADGFGNVGAVGGMPNEHQVDTAFDGSTNQQSPSFPSGLFGGAEGVDVGDNGNAYGVSGTPQAGGANMGVRDLNVSMAGFGPPSGLQIGGLAVRGQGGVNTFVRN